MIAAEARIEPDRMADSLHQANQALRKLDEAHASGYLERHRYREERRKLLEAMTESSRFAVHAAVPGQPALKPASAGRSGRSINAVWLIAGLILVAGMVAVLAAFAR